MPMSGGRNTAEVARTWCYCQHVIRQICESLTCDHQHTGSKSGFCEWLGSSVAGITLNIPRQTDYRNEVRQEWLISISITMRKPPKNSCRIWLMVIMPMVWRIT